MSARIVLTYLLMGCSLPGSLLSLQQQTLYARLVNPLLVHGAGINASGILEQEGGPKFAVFLLHFRAKPPVVASIPLSRQVPASRIYFRTGSVNGVPALTVTSERKALTKPLTFSALLTNPAIWNHDELNDIVYQLNRGFYSKDAYEFCGLVKARGKTYLGVRWYSPTASQQNLAAAVVLQVSVHSKGLDLIVLLKAYGLTDQNLYRGGRVPMLKRSPEGNLLRVDWNGTWKLLPNGEWKKIGNAPKQP